MTNEFTRVAVLLPVESGYFRGVMRGIRKYAVSRPNWLVFPMPVSPKRLKGVKSLGLDAFIAAITSQDIHQRLVELRLPVVDVAGDLPSVSFPQVLTDLEESGRVAAQHLLDTGLQHFGFFGPARLHYSSKRHQGFRELIEANGFQLSCHFLSMWTFCAPRGRLWQFESNLISWLQSLPKPVGVFVPEDMLGLQLTEACRIAKVRIPEELAIVGVDNDDLICEIARPPLSSVALPSERIGHEAAAWVDRMMDSGKRTGSSVILPPISVVARQSTDILAVNDPDLVTAMQYIRQHSNRPLAVEEVVRHVSLSRRTLERKFQMHLDRGIWDEIRRIQLQQAKTLLAETSLDMAKVAIKSGFSDQQTFSAFFRKKLGMSPTQFRKSIHAH